MNIFNNRWVIILVVYTTSNLFLLLNSGVFWDDWILYALGDERITSEFVGNGVVYMGYIHIFLQNITNNPALLYHTLTFIIGLISTILFYHILNSFKIRNNIAFIATLLLAASPYNQARQTMICIPYTIGFFFLLLGVLTFIVNVKKRNICLRILSLLTIFLSFAFLNSALVMWLAFLMFFTTYIQNKLEFNLAFFKKILQQALAWLDFIILPFCFWVIRLIYFQPKELNYNTLTLDGFVFAPMNLIYTFIINFFGLISETFRPLGGKIFVIGFIITCMFLYYLLNKLKQINYEHKYFLLIGIYFFIAGLFPYVAVEKLPTFRGFDTRFQIFLPIGASFIFIFLLSVLKNTKLQKIAFVVLISSFMMANIFHQIKYQKSWFKQASLELHFKREQLLIPNRSYLIIDQTSDYDENEEGMGNYVLSGMLEKTFNQENIFAISTKDRKEFTSDREFHYYYLIEKGEFILNSSNCIKLLYLYYFDQIKYMKNVEKVLECKVLPFES